MFSSYISPTCFFVFSQFSIQLFKVNVILYLFKLPQSLLFILFCFRCIKIALVHDLAESIVGDITPSCGVSKEAKFKREKVNQFLLKLNYKWCLRIRCPRYHYSPYTVLGIIIVPILNNLRSILYRG